LSLRLSILRRFAADPLLQAPQAMTEDQRDHPVVALIRSAATSNHSPAGARMAGGSHS
jgi:hypothetical protein